MIGSVKTNIGHLESASGIAGLIKAASSVYHRQIPANLHFQTPNPDIPFESLGLRVPAQLEPWPESRGPAMAAINSFGFGGLNALVILEQAPPATEPPASAPETGAFVLPLSAQPRGAHVAGGLVQRVLESGDSFATGPRVHDQPAPQSSQSPAGGGGPFRDGPRRTTWSFHGR